MLTLGYLISVDGYDSSERPRLTVISVVRYLAVQLDLSLGIEPWSLQLGSINVLLALVEVLGDKTLSADGLL